MAAATEQTFPDFASLRLTLPKKHKFQVMAVTISNDCHYAVFAIMASGPQWSAPQPRLHLFDLTTANELWQIDFPDNYVNCLAITPNNQEIISSSVSTTRFLNLSDGTEIRAFSQEGSRFTSLAFAPDGEHILCNNGNDLGAVRYMQLSTLQQVRSFVGHKKTIYGLAFMPNGKEVITTSADKTIKLWDLATGNEICSFIGHKKEVFTVAPFHDGSRIISGSFDKTLKLWDVQTGSEIREFAGHANYVRSVAISHDDRLAFSGSNDMSPRLWDINTGQELLSMGEPDAFVPLVKFSPNSQHILYADLKGNIWIYRHRY